MSQELHPTIYGPPPGPPPRKKFSCSMVILVIGALFAGVIAWLFGGCSNYNQPTVYGPPPVDTTQTVSPVNNE